MDSTGYEIIDFLIIPIETEPSGKPEMKRLYGRRFWNGILFSEVSFSAPWVMC